MMDKNRSNNDYLSWLLEKNQPGVRYLALRDIVKSPGNDQALIEAQKRAHQDGPISQILNEMNDEGYWVAPGPGYSPKYRGTVWSIILLGQLGASVEMDVRVARACRYLLDNALTEYGQFSASGTPGSTMDCLQGNLCGAMLDLGYKDPRIPQAFDWMARSLTGDGVAPLGDTRTPIRYYSGKCGPGFMCGANNKQPCAWGAAKVMLAFSKLPQEQWTSQIEEAVQQGINFLFSVDPATGAYPSGWNDKPSRNWWKFGFPVFYITDILQIVEALVGLGYGMDPRLSNAINIINNKQDPQGRWALEYDYSGKTWIDFGKKNLPNKWVTLRALRILNKFQDIHSINRSGFSGYSKPST